jgi:mandelate racemase
MSISDLAIREIRARPVVAPLPRPIRTASGDVLDAPLLLIDVLRDAGVMGRAYAFAYAPLTLRSLAQFMHDIAPELVGQSVSPRARMRQLEKRLKLVGWQGFAGMVAGALDMALWDALARVMDVPLCGAARWRDTAVASV